MAAAAVEDAGDINLANALDLSESEEEEEMEDIIVDFSQDREVNHSACRILRRTDTVLYLRRIKACDKSACTSSSSQPPSLHSSPNHQHNPIQADNKTPPPQVRASMSRFQPIQNLPRPCPRT